MIKMRPLFINGAIFYFFLYQCDLWPIFLCNVGIVTQVKTLLTGAIIKSGMQ